jgi:hypothetical protein
MLDTQQLLLLTLGLAQLKDLEVAARRRDQHRRVKRVGVPVERLARLAD